MKYVAPAVDLEAFTCPHCGAFAKQRWASRDANFRQWGSDARDVLSTAHCDHCGEYSVWHKKDMIFPLIGIAPPPNPDMPKIVKLIYGEAAAISIRSPRGAAGLLRLAIQVLCKELGESGENINSDIASLVKKGLPVAVQQSLDIVRVIGNNAVHPGQIDADSQDVVTNLFGLINVICEYMISLPARINGIYGGLPAGTLAAITKRDT